MAAYIAPELLAMDMTDITPLHLGREWTRLLKCGGHTHKTKTPRPMKPKTVRNIAGLASSAFARAIKWGLAGSPALGGQMGAISETPSLTRPSLQATL